MSLEEYSEDFFKGPAYALVIGISKYKYGKNPGEAILGNEFLNLTCPANDAVDFAEFLTLNGMIGYNVKRLINDEADLTSIKTEIDELGRKCRHLEESENPLVVVFFSGHGMVDRAKRHYLLPWEAKGDNLLGTALWHKDFWNYLDGIQTNRLVVFLDACHSGTTGDEEAMGTAPTYSPLEELGQGSGRYCIASCRPGEFSYEGEKNSIFTEKLLQLLRCEDPDAIKEEAIDIFHLYPALRKRVKEAAAERDWKQEPTVSKMEAATGIILAINQRVRDSRLKAKEQSDESRRQFAQMVCNQLAQNDTFQKTIIRAQLKSYVEKGRKDDVYSELFALFDAFSEAYRLQEKYPQNFCDLLVDKYKNVGNQPQTSKETRAQNPSKGADEFVPSPQAIPPAVARPEPKPSVATADLRPTPPPALAITSEEQKERRQFVPEDVDCVLAEAETIPDFYAGARQLRNMLGQPVSQAEFTKQIHAIGKNRADDRTSDLLVEIIRRFLEKWPNAAVVQTQTLSMIIGGRNR